VVQMCSFILQLWQNHRLECPALSDLVCNIFCMMATSEGVFNTALVLNVAGHVVNCKRANSRSLSVNDILILFLRSALNAKKVSMLTKRFQKFSLQCFLRALDGFQMNH